MNLANFETLYDMIPEASGEFFTLDTLIDFAAMRFNDSISTNPYFYYGPVSGTIARNTGFCFVANLMANYSSGKPELSEYFFFHELLPSKLCSVPKKADPSRPRTAHDILKTFYSVTGERGNFIYTKGHERIPSNWAKTPIDYGLVQLNLDIVQFILKYPMFANIGGNLGRVNTFTGVNLLDPVNGVTNLLEGGNLMCFVLEIINFAAPNYLNNIFESVLQPLKMLTDALTKPLLSLACPQLEEITRDGVPLWEALGREFPGANRSGIPL